MIPVVAAAVLSAPTGAPADHFVVVLEKHTVLFEKASHFSQATRLVYPGEILHVVATLEVEGEAWVKVRMTDDLEGYVRAEKVSEPRDVTTMDWRPPFVIRDERPFAVGLVYWGPTFGYGLNLRWNLMSRLGVAFTLGAVLNDDRSEFGGASASLGLTSFLILWNLSPMVELGINTLYYGGRQGTLRVWTLYAKAGLEWMFDWGMFINVHATYLVAVDRGVTYDIAAYDAGQLVTGDDFGPFDVPAGDTFHFLQPGVTVGWAF